MADENQDAVLRPLPETRFWADSMRLDRPGVFFEHPAELFVTLKCSRSVEYDQPLFTDEHMHSYAASSVQSNVAPLRSELEALRKRCEAVEAQHATLVWIMRAAEAAKEECGMDPESPAAIRNSRLASISQAAAQALGIVRGPAIAAAQEPSHG